MKNEDIEGIGEIWLSWQKKEDGNGFEFGGFLSTDIHPEEKDFCLFKAKLCFLLKEGLIPATFSENPLNVFNQPITKEYLRWIGLNDDEIVAMTPLFKNGIIPMSNDEDFKIIRNSRVFNNILRYYNDFSLKPRFKPYIYKTKEILYFPALKIDLQKFPDATLFERAKRLSCKTEIVKYAIKYLTEEDDEISNL